MRFSDLKIVLPAGPIGALVTDVDGGIRVMSVQEGSNSAKAGLLANDMILSLNDLSMQKLSLKEFVRMAKEELFDKEKVMIIQRAIQDEKTVASVGNAENENDSTSEHEAKKRKTTKDHSSDEIDAASDFNIENENDSKSTMSGDEKCDVCTKPDNQYSTCLQTCKSCKVSVHENCYGLVNTYENKKYKEWLCHACKSVGQSIVVEVETKSDHTNKCIVIDTTKRPMRCELCSIKTGSHAMHPLFSTYGSRGRPVIRSVDGTYRMAWVHSVCALVLCANKFTAGLVYGCDEEGIFENDEDENDEDVNDYEPGDPYIELSYFENGEELLTPNPHHFAINNENSDGVDFLQRLRDFRSLTCYICKVKPKDQKRRIPLQCSYGDCQTAFHVGCSKWGCSINRILFSSVETVVIAEGYCVKHYKIKKNQILGFDERASSEEEMEDLDFVDDGSVSSFEYEDELVVSGRENTVSSIKTPSATKSKLLNTSKYTERKKILEIAVGEVRKAHEDKEVRRLMVFWKERLPKQDFKKLQKLFKDRLVAEDIVDNNVEEDISNSRKKIDPSPWDNMFLPNYVRGSLNFDGWEDYQSISESEM